MLAERLSRKHIGEVHLDEGDGDTRKGVAQRHAGMGERRRVDDDANRSIGARLLNAVDQLALVIALTTVDMHAQLTAETHQSGVDVGQRGDTLDVRLTGSEQIQIGAVQHQHTRCRSGLEDL